MLGKVEVTNMPSAIIMRIWFLYRKTVTLMLFQAKNYFPNMTEKLLTGMYKQTIKLTPSETGCH